MVPQRDLLVVWHDLADGAFARWLTLKLTCLGYRTWCSATPALLDDPFTHESPQIVREQAAKLLLVLSRTSSERDPLLTAPRIACGIRQLATGAPIALCLDEEIARDWLSHPTNAEANAAAIDFSDGWADGLRHLVTRLQQESFPTHAQLGPDTVRRWWDETSRRHAAASATDGRHSSNWFPLHLPETVYLHTLAGPVETMPVLPFPAVAGHTLTTFAPASDLAPVLRMPRIRTTRAVPTSRFLSSGRPQERRAHRGMVAALVNDAWRRAVAARLPTCVTPSGAQAVYFDRTCRPPAGSGRIGSTRHIQRGLIGATYEASGWRHWHFGVSAHAAMHPLPIVMLRSHVLFSDDGAQLWTSPSKVQRARLPHCERWSNEDWRDRLLAAMSWLSNGEPILMLPLGSSVSGAMRTTPLAFIEPIAPDESRDYARLPAGIASADIVDAGAPTW